MRYLASMVLLSLAFTSAAQQPYWLKDIGSLGQDNIADVKTDNAGNVYAIGDFRGTINVDGTSYGSNGSSDVIVMKTDVAGAVQWLVHCGGVGIDRGLKLCVDNTGTLAVTGQFSGTSVIFGTSLTSEAGTLDVFTAKLDASTGTAQWVVQGGSANGSDKPYGITISPNGNITVAGDFSGAATFSGNTITSMIDPNTLLPSVDVFIASYSSAGALLWLQQGTAKYTDRAIDVVSDAANNLYVCGQFSDTVTFDVTHNNSIYNATFLIKFDAAGNEQWFRRCGGAMFNYVRDMQMDAPNELLLCGDLRGTMHFFDTSPNTISASAAYSYYLLRVGTDGELVRDTVIGSANPLTVRALDQRGDSVAVLGEFKCQFTGMSAHYGSGLFMAIGAQDLFVVRHRLHDLSFRDAQQFGGIGGKRGGQIASLTNGALIFCGAFENDLVCPSDGSTWGGYGSVEYSAGANPALQVYCGDSTYNAYALLMNHGGKDGFIARGYALHRSPYDIWYRNANDPCLLGPLQPCLMISTDPPACVDTVYDCYPQPFGQINPWLYMNIFGSWSLPIYPDPDNIGPQFNYLWSDGSTDYLLYPTQTGWYSCTVTSTNGCFSYTDSIYCIVTPPPLPLISDGTGTNVNAGVYQTQAIILCDTTTYIWYSALQPGDSVIWYRSGVPVYNDTIVADSGGVYTVVVVNAAGCIAVNTVNVATALGTLPNITGWNFTFMLGNDTLHGDTVPACYGGCVSGPVLITWYIDGVPAPLPGNIHISWFTDIGCPIPPPDILWSVAAFAPGWHVFNFVVQLNNLPCGNDQAQYSAIDSIYLEIVPMPHFDHYGPSVICPDDTVPLTVFNCVLCDTIEWSGGSPGSITSISNGMDTCWVDQAGQYYVSACHLDLGLTCCFPPEAPIIFTVAAPPPPQLYISPAFICPGDSALIYTFTTGTNYHWTGPNGPIAVNDYFIYAHDFGDYELSMTDTNGCVVSNGPVTLNAYGTPYLDVGDADNVICPGDSLQIFVVADNATSIAWQPPLSGNGLSQTVFTGGTYTCAITACGITTVASIVVVAGTPEAQILYPGPFTLCGIDTILLQAAAGQAFYDWQPGDFMSEVFPVTQPGTYSVIVSDDYGCMDTSAVVIVTSYAIAQPLTAQDTTVCEGGSATLFATGSGTLTWYSDANATQPIGSGGSISIGPLAVGDTLYVVQQDSACTSDPLAVIVDVTPLPVPPSITGDTTLCQGDALALLASGSANSTFSWSTPQGSISGASINVPSATLANAGIYICVSDANGCASDSAFVTVSVDSCIVIEHPDPVVPNVFTPNGDGVNDVIHLLSPSHSPLAFNIFNRWGKLVYTTEGVSIIWNGRTSGNDLLSDGVYYYELLGTRVDGSAITLSGYIQVMRER